MGLFLIRVIMPALITSLLFEYPKAQVILLTLTTISMLLNMVINKPFLSTKNKIEMVSYEIIILTANLSTIILAFNENNENVRDGVGVTIISCFVIFSIASLFFIFFGII